MQRGTRDLRLLSLAVFCQSLGFGAFSAAYTNFIVEVVHINAFHLGIVEGLRETPGFLIVLVAALTMSIAEPILAGIALLVMAVGMTAYCKVGTVPALVLWSVVWSIGLHAWMTLQPSMTLNLAKAGHKGKRMGQMSAISGVGTVFGMIIVFGAKGLIHFTGIFIVAGVALATGALAVSMISRNIGHAEKPRLVFKRKYSLYYVLTFLEGCRKQIFMTFAIFLLVKDHHVKTQVVAVLMIINNIVNASTFTWVGKLIDRHGERKVLAVCYLAAIPIFLGYAYTPAVFLLYILYCLDNLFYIGSIGSTTYLQKIAEPQDVMPSLAMGVSMNHAAAVAVPLIGGALWVSFGHTVTFYGGAVIAAISVLSVMGMKTRTRQLPESDAVLLEEDLTR
jgi:hypothetical protein